MRIPLSQIDIEDLPLADEKQQRVQELADSMKELGLSHQVILRKCSAGERFPIASGELRVRAAMLLGWPDIEAEVRDVDVIRGKEIRIHENLKRFNLPWWEQVVLVEELHNLRQQEHGVAQKGRPDKSEGKQGWSIRDTAAELEVGIGPLSEDLSLARALRSDPTLSKVKDKKTAIRLVRIATQRYTSEQEANAPSNIQKLEGNEVFFGDSASILKQLPSSSVDHCITDPPWIKFFEPSLRLDERTLPVFRELYRVLKNPGMLYLFCGLDDFAYYTGTTVPDPNDPSETIHLQGELEKIGFSVSTTPVIWRKGNSLSRRGVRPWEYDRDFEFVIVAAKGSPALTTSRRLSGIKEADIVHPSHMIHPNEKPLSIIEDILTDCSYEGNLIIDPFAGSGVVGEACKKNGRRYILCERDKKFYDQICVRLKG